jgi:hypothetical protein
MVMASPTARTRQAGEPGTYNGYGPLPFISRRVNATHKRGTHFKAMEQHIERHIYGSISPTPVIRSYPGHVGMRVHSQAKSKRARAERRRAWNSKYHPYLFCLRVPPPSPPVIRARQFLTSLYFGQHGDSIEKGIHLFASSLNPTPLLRSCAPACCYLSAAACPSSASLLPPLHTYTHTLIHTHTHTHTHTYSHT